MSLRPGYKANKTNDDLGMHILYDGTKNTKIQKSVEEDEDNPPCMEPIEYTKNLPTRTVTTPAH